MLPEERARMLLGWRHQGFSVHRGGYTRMPAEELYETAGDPFEMNNLAQDPGHAEAKARLSRELDQWLAEQGDPGVPQDTKEAIDAARLGKHLYGPAGKK